MSIPAACGVASMTLVFGFDNGRLWTKTPKNRHIVHLWVIPIGAFGLFGYGLGRMYTWLKETESEEPNWSLEKVALIAVSVGLMVGSLYYTIYQK